MNIFYLLIGVSLFAALIFLGAFIWAVRDGQFEDQETPPRRILFDDDPVDGEQDK
ncbi:MAG: cbb3-type cytochrome oxidase assembly protein CcoS [Bacteroidetes bacterium]|nr:MAG: cbb3-type cytochrome oxidase assembly protein CcoS [Bacteroidota bacterium]